ncbi:GerAB/ArcD/ProY family transporter [Ferviditalea candida]|uniref:Endospore germination permease n=1 Tax=Ferviditalea candida TaxID=3108399 RepID=A0ABU5ZKE5_9BACL|nr:endospore germination permease [Paenibacillaceae bacterium T2]
MSEHEKLKISTYQIVWLVGAFAPVGLTSLPRELNEYTQQSGWMFALAASLLILLPIRLLVNLTSRYPQQNFASILESILGKFAGKFMMLILSLYIIISTAFSIRIMTDGVITYLLFHTPKWIIIAAALAVSVYAIHKGAKTIIRFNEFIQPVLFMTFFAIFILVFNKSDFTNLLPLVSREIQWRNGVLLSVYPFFHLLALAFFFPFTANPKQLWNGAVWGTQIINFTFLILFILNIGIFGSTELNYIQHPGIEMARLIELPILERMEIVFMTYWILYSFTLFIVGTYSGSVGLQQLFNRGPRSWWALAVGAVVYVLSLLPENIDTVHQLELLLNQVNAVMMFMFVPLLTLADRIKKKARS